MWLQDVLSRYVFTLKYTVVTLWSVIAVLLFWDSAIFCLPLFLPLCCFRNFCVFMSVS